MIITLAQVKTYLGIVSSDYDDAINRYIPIVDARVKAICKNDFNMLVIGNTTDTSAVIPIVESYYDYYYPYQVTSVNINQPIKPEDIQEYINAGDQVTGTGIPAGAYVLTVDDDPDYISPRMTISDNATADGTGIKLYIGMNIAYLPLVAKGVFWMIGQENTTMPTNSASSERMGPASVSYGAGDQAIDNKYGMPGWFVKGLPKYARGH